MSETRDIAWKRLSVEAAAIVASILLAFAIDAWWDDHNEVERERRLLQALLVEFEQNTELLRESRQEYELYYMDALWMLEYLRDEPDSVDPASFEKAFRGLLLTGSTHLESGTYDGLLGSGELGLIRDEKLRNRLAAWPSYVKEWTEEESVFSFVRTRLYPHLYDSIRFRNVSSEFRSFPDGESPPSVPTGEAGVAEMIEISSSIEFENLVYLKAQGVW
jgi:hypothetical protein